MAVTDIKQSEGFTENPVVPKTPQEVSQASGDTPPPVSSAPLAPKIAPVVPGEVLPPPQSQGGGSSPQENMMSNMTELVGGLAEALAPPEVEAPVEEAVVAVPPIPKINNALPTGDGDGGRSQSLLSGMAPEAYAQIHPLFSNTALPSAVPPAGVANDRGYTSRLYEMASGKAPEATPQQIETYQAGKSVQNATNTAAAGGDPIAIAAAFIGQDERDPAQSAALAAFFKEAGGVSADPSTTAWCAAFINAVLGRAGLGGTGKLNAQSFLNYGTAVDAPRVGDVVVFERGPKGGWQGHVGLIAGIKEDGTLSVLGGNQSTDESEGRGVTININDFGTERVLGYRRPTAPGAQNG